MALAAQRNAEEVMAGLGAWLRHDDPAGEPEVVGHWRPSVGFSTETILVDIVRTGASGRCDERLVLKLPPSGPGIFPTYDFALQARVQEVAAASGVPAPVPVRVEDDTSWVGTPFLVMPAISGHIIGEVPVLDPWLVERGAIVHGHFLDTIADIHRIDWRAHGLGEVVPARDNTAEIARWRDYLGWYGDGAVLVPALVDALDWCGSHRPEAEAEASLLWGDVRLGNVIFDEVGTPVAVLDWEMATIGAAEHDLAWTLILDAIQAELLGRRVAGFLDHDAAVARFEARQGRQVRDLGWYEIFAMVRSTAIMTRIAHLRDLAGEPGLFPIAENPLIGILERRIAAAEGVGEAE